MKTVNMKKPANLLELELLAICLRGTPAEFTRRINGETPDWDYLLELALYHQVFPIVYPFLKSVTSKDIPEFVPEKLKMMVIRYSFRDAALRNKFKETILLLNKNHVRFCLLKGLVLGETLYGDSSLRPTSDLDVLVAKEDAAGAAALLQSLGFQLQENVAGLEKSQWESVLRRYHHVALSDGKVMLELHWRLKSSKYQVVDDCETEAVMAESVTKVFEGLRINTLKPEDEFMHLLFHGSLHYWSRLKWLNDIVLYLEKYPDLNLRAIKERFRNNSLLNSYCQTFLLISRLYGDDKVEGILSPRDITLGGRVLYNLTFPFLLSTKSMKEYSPFDPGYYRKMLYVWFLLSGRNRRIRFLKYQLLPEIGQGIPYVLTHFTRIKKSE